jgi:hypothetical protein
MLLLKTIFLVQKPWSECSKQCKAIFYKKIIKFKIQIHK